MLQKPWFKVFIWFMATFFFFLASGVVISILRPGPSEMDVMKFMMGMMSAMDKSIMGVTMSIEHNGVLQYIILLSISIILPVIVISAVIGFLLRLVHWRGKDV